MLRRGRILLAVPLVAALLVAGLVIGQRFRSPSSAYALVDETTLVVLQGTVSVQRAGEDFTAVTGDVPVREGDRVRTGPDGYGVVTYFEGSTTSIQPNTEIVIRRLERLPGGGAQISFHQEIGLTWNRVERLVDASSRFETTAASTVAFVRGTEYTLRVTATQQVIVEAVTDAVTVETVVDGVVVSVEVQPGFQTTVESNRPPTPPVPVPSASFSVRVDVEGPANPFVTDERNRSVGFQSQVDVYTSQIPGATYAVGGGRHGLHVPDPVRRYELRFKGQSEGTYTVTITALVQGQEVAQARGMARPLAAQQRTGNIRRDQLDRLGLEVDPERRTLQIVGQLQETGETPGRAAFPRAQVPGAGPASSDRLTPTRSPTLTPTMSPATSTGIATRPPTDTPTPTTTPTRTPSPFGTAPTITQTATGTGTPSPATATSTAVPTTAPIATATPTQMPTATPTAASSATESPTLTATFPEIPTTAPETSTATATVATGMGTLPDPASGAAPPPPMPPASGPPTAAGPPAPGGPTGAGPFGLLPTQAPPAPPTPRVTPIPPTPSPTQTAAAPFTRALFGGGPPATPTPTAEPTAGTATRLVRAAASDLVPALLDVTFSDGVFTNPDATGRLAAADFTISDIGMPGLTVLAVSHQPGRATATLILSGAARAGSTTLRAKANEIFDAEGRAISDAPITVTGGP